MAMPLIGIFDPKQLAHSPLTRIACGSAAASPETPERASILLGSAHGCPFCEARMISELSPGDRLFQRDAYGAGG
jgi:hypothetical protein